MTPTRSALPEEQPGRAPERVLLVGSDGSQAFLRTWAAWRDDPRRPRRLHVVCLGVDAALWLRGTRPPVEWPELARALAEQSRGLLPGIHRLAFEDEAVQLTLGVGPALPALQEQDLLADEICLTAVPAIDNAPTWARALARCCRRGTRLAGFAADWIPALTQAGFRMDAPEPRPGAVRTAVFDPAWQPRKRYDPNRPAQALWPSRCVVIGAGLAGAACAASLARRGWQVTVLERAMPASGASGLPAGLMAPHVSPDDGPLSRLSRAGLRATLRQARQLLVEGQDWAPTGVLQRRLEPGAALPRPWPAEGHFWSRNADDESRLPADLRRGALWHEQGAWIKPARLVQAWLAQPGVQTMAHAQVHRLERRDGAWHALASDGSVLADAPLVIVASAYDSMALLAPLLPEPVRLNLQPIRGQVSWAVQTPPAHWPEVPVNGHGSLLPAHPTEEGPAWVLGATFDRDDTDPAPRAQDHARTLEKLDLLLPEVAASLKARFGAGQVQAWAGVRCAWRDHLPVVGPLSDALPGLCLCTAFGSRGLSYSAMCAELMAAWLHDEPLPIEARLASLLQARRLLRVGPRAAR